VLLSHNLDSSIDMSSASKNIRLEPINANKINRHLKNKSFVEGTTSVKA
jgi:hypothetical protein